MALTPITLPDGSVVESSLSPEELGIAPIAPPPPPPGMPAPLAGSQGVAATGEQLFTPGSAPMSLPPDMTSTEPPPLLAPPEPEPEGPMSKSPDELVRVGGSGASAMSSGGPSTDEAGQAGLEYFRHKMRDRGSPGRAVKVAEHDQLGGFTIERGPQISDEDKEALTDADIDRRIAAGNTADLQAEKAEAEANRLRRKNLADEADLIRDEGEHQKREYEIKAEVDAKVAEHQRDVDAVRAGKVDPNRYWNDKSTGSKILATIGMAFGQYAAALTGGENTAAKLINAQIERDIQAQTEDLANAKDAAALSRSELGRLMEKHGDLRTAQADLRARQHAVAQGMAAQYAAAAASPEIKANYEQWLAEDRQKSVERDAQFRMAAEGSRREAWTHIPEHTKYYGGRRAANPVDAARDAAALTKSLREIEGSGASPEQQSEMRSRIVPGYGYAYTTAGAEKMREGLGYRDAIQGDIADMKRVLRDSHAGKIGVIEAKKRLETLKEGLRGKISKSSGMGSLDDGLVKSTDKQIGSPESLLKLAAGAGSKQLDQLSDSISKGFDEKIKANVTTDPGGRTPALKRPSSVREE